MSKALGASLILPLCAGTFRFHFFPGVFEESLVSELSDGRNEPQAIQAAALTSECGNTSIFQPPSVLLVLVVACNIRFIQRSQQVFPYRRLRVRVEEESVVNGTKFLAAVVCGSSFPNYLVAEIHSAENAVEQHSQIMTRSWIAMQIEAAGWFEDTMKLDQARRHHREVGHHR
jgi:hypothetical protein